MGVHQERRRSSECPINELQAAQLLQNDKDLQKSITEVKELILLLQQHKTIQDQHFCSRLRLIEAKQTDIIATITEYKKYVFAAAVIISLVSGVTVFAVGILDHIDIIRSIFSARVFS